MNHNHWDNTATFLLYLSIIILLSMMTLLNLTPPIARDALIHHLAVPKLWLKHGGIYEIPWANYAYYPMNIDLLYVLCLFFHNDIVPKFIHLAFGMGAGLLIYFYLKPKFGRNWGLLGMIIFISTPIVIWLSTAAYVDLGMTFFTTGSVLAFIKWRDSEYSRFKWFLISSFCMGIAIGSKYNALIAWFIVNLMLMLSYVRDTNRQKGAIKYGLMFFVITVLVASPWYLKNLIQTGNPFYPLFGGFFKSLNHHPAILAASGDNVEKTRQISFFKMREIMFGENFLKTFLIPIRMFFQGQDNSYQYFQGVLNPILIIFSPFILFRKKYGKDKFLFVFFTVIFIFMAYFLTAKQVRYILPVLPFLAILAVMGIKDLLYKIGESPFFSSLRFGEKIKSIPSGLVFASLAVLLSLNFIYLKNRSEKINPLPYVLGRETKETFLKHHLFHYDSVEYINNNLPTDAVVFTMFLGRRGFYLDRAYKNEPSFGMNTIRRMVVSSADENTFDNFVQSMKVTHILMRSDFFYKFLYENFSKAQINRLSGLINKRWTKLYDHNRYVVWNIQPSSR